MAGINFIRRWVMGQMKKTADDGIMITLPDKNKVDLNVSITMDRLIRNGIDPNQITSPQQVDNAINMINSRMVNRAIPADSAEGREITEKLFGKQKAPVFDMEGNRIPERSGIMGGKAIKDLMQSGQVSKGARGMKKSKKVQDREMFQAANERLTSDVDSIIKNIKSMEPITAMKEANSVIGRKGKYKNLTPEQSKKILQDTEDHIFERDIPEDFAAGGVAGLLGERPKYQTGGDVAFDASDASVYGSSAITVTPETVADAFGNQVQQEMGNTYNPPLIQEVQEEKANVEDIKKDNITENENIAGNPNGVGVNEPKNDFLDNFVNPRAPELIGAPDTKPILGTGMPPGGELLGTPEERDNAIPTLIGRSKPKSGLPGIEFTGISGAAAGPNNPVGVIINGKRTSVSQGLISAYREAVDSARKRRADGFMGREVLPGEMGIENFMSMYDKQQETKPMAFKGSPLAQAALANGGIARAGFMAGGMGRRGFLKMLAGLGAGIGAAKTGLLKFAGKEPAKQVAKEVVKQSASTPPPYFFKLAEKIKMLGDDATATTERVIAKSLKSKDGKSEYLLQEDMVTGDTIIKKINKEGDDMITDVEIMELRKGEDVVTKDGKAMRTPDEYEEVTEANARIEGDVFNDPYYTDGIQIDDIMKEVGEQAPSIKKASGGIARMLGE